MWQTIDVLVLWVHGQDRGGQHSSIPVSISLCWCVSSKYLLIGFCNVSSNFPLLLQVYKEKKISWFSMIITCLPQKILKKAFNRAREEKNFRTFLQNRIKIAWDYQNFNAGQRNCKSFLIFHSAILGFFDSWWIQKLLSHRPLVLLTTISSSSPSCSISSSSSSFSSPSPAPLSFSYTSSSPSSPDPPLSTSESTSDSSCLQSKYKYSYRILVLSLSGRFGKSPNSESRTSRFPYYNTSTSRANLCLMQTNFKSSSRGRVCGGCGVLYDYEMKAKRIMNVFAYPSLDHPLLCISKIYNTRPTKMAYPWFSFFCSSTSTFISDSIFVPSYRSVYFCLTIPFMLVSTTLEHQHE